MEEDMDETQLTDPSSPRPPYDVFIIYNTEDTDVMNRVLVALEKHATHPLTCCTQHDFRIGQSVFNNIVETQDKSHITLLIITDKALISMNSPSRNCQWILLETILQLEKSHQSDTLNIRFLIDSVCEKEVTNLKTGLFRHLHLPEKAFIVVDFSQGDWAGRVIDSVKETIHMKNILPVGNLAHGQVFSLFIGYLRHILPILKSAIEKLDTYRTNPGCMSTKYYMLLSGACEVEDCLAGRDGSERHDLVIEDEGTLTLCTFLSAGKHRDFSPSIYSIRKRNKTKKFYFVGGFPDSLNAVFKMKKFIDFDALLQVVRFYFTMNEVLNHLENVACNDIVHFVLYGRAESMEKVLYDTIKQDVQSKCESPDISDKLDQLSLRTAPQRLLSRPTEYKKDVVIFCSSSDPKGTAFEAAMSIKDYLTKNNKQVEFEGQRWTESIENARWNIFVLSPEFRSDNCQIMKCMSAMAEGISYNDLRTIPVLVGDLRPEDLPRFIKWITVICSSETKYLQTLLQTINGGPITTQDRLPAGDVATGLAWDYAISYLPITLKDLKRRIEEHLRSKELPCGCIYGMFILIPRSCDCQHDVVECLNHGFPPSNVPVKFLGYIEPVTCDVAGTKGRTFKLAMYQYTNIDTCKSVCFLCEFATPANHLHEMANKYPFAGLTKDGMYRQVEEFGSLLEKIVQADNYIRQMGDISHLVKLVNYNDSDKNELLRTLRQQAGLDHDHPPDLIHQSM